MNLEKIYISGVGSISALGASHTEVRNSYQRSTACIRPVSFGVKEFPVAKLSEPGELAIARILEQDLHFAGLDQTALFGIHAARAALMDAGWRVGEKQIGVSMGSSRGATTLFERYHRAFLEHAKQRVPVLTSPTTTLGNISSNIAHSLGVSGPAISHSVTCSSALQALANSVAWIRAGMCERFVVGGSEAPLTPFTLAQMEALRIYAQEPLGGWYCRPCSAEENRGNTFVLGEGAAVFCIESSATLQKAPRAEILGIALGLENPNTATALSQSGTALKRAMKEALSQLVSGEGIDLVVLHAPGTEQGDRGELEAIYQTFGATPPVLTSNKWLIGHTLGASAALSLEYAINILESGAYAEFPYPVPFRNTPRPISRIMVNAAGFGGNAASIVIGR